MYRDYRWISVVSNLTYNENGEIEGTYFNREISLNLSNLVDLNSIKVIKDGNSYVIGYNGIIFEEGNYVLSFKSTVSQVNSSQQLLKSSSAVLSESSADIQSSDFKFTIDKTSPIILESYTQTIDEGTQISADILRII